MSCLAERDQNACRGGSFTPRAQVNWWMMQDKFYKSKSSSHFERMNKCMKTWMLAMLGKWATTHNRVFFLGKNCSWTLLPGSPRLRTPITCSYISCVGSYRTHFASSKRVYQGFMMSTSRQATRYLKTMLKILVDRAVMRHISFLSEWHLR